MDGDLRQRRNVCRRKGEKRVRDGQKVGSVGGWILGKGCKRVWFWKEKNTHEEKSKERRVKRTECVIDIRRSKKKRIFLQNERLQREIEIHKRRTSTVRCHSRLLSFQTSTSHTLDVHGPFSSPNYAGCQQQQLFIISPYLRATVSAVFFCYRIGRYSIMG